MTSKDEDGEVSTIMRRSALRRLPNLREGGFSPLKTSCRNAHPKFCHSQPNDRLRRCGLSVTSRRRPREQAVTMPMLCRSKSWARTSQKLLNGLYLIVPIGRARLSHDLI